MMSPLEEGRAEILMYFDSLLTFILLGKSAYERRFTTSELNLLDTIERLIDSTMRETEDDAASSPPE